jgi:AraC-like DNA-binding protein/quercetin dioxygenase-like cupin family protein
MTTRGGAQPPMRHTLSNMRHGAEEEPPVRGYAVTHPGGGAVLPQSAGWDQLIYASSGVMTVHTGDGIWVVPPDRAVWVPATVAHRIEMAGRTAVRTLYFRTGLVPLPARCRAVNVGPLLRELVAHAVPRCPLRLTEPREQRLIGVIIDQLAEAPTAPLRLPRPTDPRAEQAALVLLGHATARIPAVEGVSRRQLERIFRADTGLTLRQYRERARLLAALPRLAAGEPVARVATDVGYATPSAFGAMFRRVLGVSPSGYFSGR